MLEHLTSALNRPSGGFKCCKWLWWESRNVLDPIDSNLWFWERRKWKEIFSALKCVTLLWARAKTSSSLPHSLSIQTGASMCMNKSQDNADEKCETILTFIQSATGEPSLFTAHPCASEKRGYILKKKYMCTSAGNLMCTLSSQKLLN